MITRFLKCTRMISNEFISRFRVLNTQRDVKIKYNAIMNELTGVVEGHLSSRSQIPEFLTPQRALEIMVKAMRAHGTRLNELWQNTVHDEENLYRLMRSKELINVK